MRVVSGKLVGSGLRFGIVVSRFNELISGKLLEGAKDILVRHEVRHQDIDVFWVPGAWEIPLAVKELALSGRYDALLALGAVIRGDTPHFDYVAAETSKGLAHVGLEHRMPVAFGVLTCDDLEQALLREGLRQRVERAGVRVIIGRAGLDADGLAGGKAVRGSGKGSHDRHLNEMENAAPRINGSAALRTPCSERRQAAPGAEAGAYQAVTMESLNSLFT